MDLLSSRDLLDLQTALDCGLELELARTYTGGVRVTARTRRAGPAWAVPMVVQLRVERPGGKVWLQSFETIDDLRRAL